MNTAGTGGGSGGPGSGCGTGSGAGATSSVDAYDPTKSTVTPQTGSSVIPPDGVNIYMGADDNLDAGEHDGVDGTDGTTGSINGPSDGGAVAAHLVLDSAIATESEGRADTVILRSKTRSA